MLTQPRATEKTSNTNKICTESVMSRLRKGQIFHIAIYWNVAYIQMAAAFTYKGNLSCLDTDPEFQH